MNDTAQSLDLILSPQHLSMLRQESGISDQVISARGYRTITLEQDLRDLGFAASQSRVPGLLLPLWATDGSNGLCVYRPDKPRVVEDRKRRNPDGTYPCRELKYEVPKGSSTRLDCPPTCKPMLQNPSIPLWVTEGQKKADSLASRGLCAIALLGVWNWRGKNDVGGVVFLADWDRVALNGREVRIVFDSDVMTKAEVRAAIDRLTENLQRKKAHVTAVYLPPAADGSKQGVDDYLAAGHTAQDLEALVTAPRPVPKAAEPVVEMLDAAPPTLRRLLAILNGRAYAATWVHTKVTRTESQNSKGEIVRHDPPIVKNEQRLIVVRDDGRVFAQGAGVGDELIENLGAEVRLPEVPPADRLWSAAGVKVYRAGQRADPVEVFGKVVDVVNRFIDFDRSLADQATMARMIGCYILATWFLDAFNVIGFLWPTGDRGSGKTQLLTVIAEMGHLGQVVLSGGSFASLRDLADYGACIAFDDAEMLSNPKQTDPDKRALLLAGNRRGNSVPLKELTGDKTWRTRYVDTFCPRLFSAIRLPDPVLASRTIVVPLIRTPDRYRANADPLEYSLWPYERRPLIDSLWALALGRLPEVQSYEEKVNQKARLTGRNLEPWRELSMKYQDERPGLEPGDLTGLVIRALCRVVRDTKIAVSHCDMRDVGDISDIKIEIPDRDWIFFSEAITDAAQAIARDEDLDFDVDHLTSRRIGRSLGKMRLTPHRQAGKGKRQWEVTWAELERWTATYSLSLPDELGLNLVVRPPDAASAESIIGAPVADHREVFDL
jgi:hypothetical protein